MFYKVLIKPLVILITALFSFKIRKDFQINILKVQRALHEIIKTNCNFYNSKFKDVPKSGTKTYEL